MEINTLSQLDEAIAKRQKSVSFNFQSLSREENLSWEQKFNFLFDECGCASGRKFILYSSPLLIIVLIILKNTTDLSRTMILGLFVASVFLAGAAGKVIGLIQRKNKMQRLMDEFRTNLNNK